MKSKPGRAGVILIIILLTIFSLHAFSQWSDTKNNFADTLSMPVSEAADHQQYPLVVRSYPDSGWIFIWQDNRNTAVNGIDIFAQKFDKNGVRQWALDGVPVATGSNNQYYMQAQNTNYRNYSMAATDSAGGFYLTYIDDSVNNTAFARVYVQNILSNGTPLVPGGFQVATTPPGQGYYFSNPQLIADERGGFYLSYIKNELGSQYVYGFNYKKQGGTLIKTAGGWLNQYARESQSIGPCGIINTVTPFSMGIHDYNIWPDGQGGCNVIMNMSLVGGANVIGFNRLCRVKKDCQTLTYWRSTDIANCDPHLETYHKDDVVQLYKYRQFSNTVSCTSGSGAVVQTSYYIENGGFGFQIFESGALDYYYVKGATLNTPGNVNADIITFNIRKLVNNAFTPVITKAISLAVEKYDSIPYELASNDFCYTAMRFSPEGKILDKVANMGDTIMGQGGSNFYNFTIAASADKFYTTAKIRLPTQFDPVIYLQSLKLVQAAPDSFEFQYNSPSKYGVIIGQDVNGSIFYDDPMVAIDTKGNGVFYINESGRYTRVSPIINGVELAWGAMGRPTGTGKINGWPYGPEKSFMVMDPANGMGVLAWYDSRTPFTTFFNIHMRRLDSLDVGGYSPPIKNAIALFPGNSSGFPAVLTGISKKYSMIEAYSSATLFNTPMVEILDNFNLGFIEVGVYYNGSTPTPIRRFNGKPYLDMNYTIKVQNNPSGNPINVRLYFTTAQFNALQIADPTITNPGRLAVVKQANAFATAPSTYTPVAGEEVIVPVGWAAVPGGYYIEIQVTSFSNFFIFKNENALPVRWVNVYASWQNKTQAKVSWQIDDEVNVKEYIVQHSKDGSSFADVCTVAATNSSNYNCTVPGDNDVKNYYRVKEVDKDGNVNYSKVVVLSGSATDNLITLYPNPASKVLNIRTSIELREMTIVDGYGRNLFTYRGQNRVTSIDVSRYAKGIYTLAIIAKDGTKHYTKFMVE